jgi:toxin YoeB
MILIGPSPLRQLPGRQPRAPVQEAGPVPVEEPVQDRPLGPGKRLIRQDILMCCPAHLLRLTKQCSRSRSGAKRRRINKLVEDLRRDPFTGIGKPEPLKYHLPGAWSRRIDDEHRLVYVVTEAEIIILAARYHY